MTQAVQDRIEDYLNGLLSEKETRKFESDLTRQDVAAEFREILVMRELLQSLPPDAPPPGLVERIEASLELDVMIREESVYSESSSSLSQIINAFRWSFRWPGYALAGVAGSSAAFGNTASNMKAIGYVLGPFQKPIRDRIRPARFQEKPLWKIVLSRLW